MDYVNNDFLASWQWKIINNPGFVWNFLEGDEDAMAKKLTGTYIVYVGDSIMTDKRIFINTNKQSKLYLKYTPMVSDTVTTINAKVVYCPEWSDKNIFWPTENSWGKLNVNTKTSFPLDSLPEGKYMVLIRDKNQNVDTLKFYLWNKKYDFACSVCGRNLALTLSKLQQIFPDNKNLIQQYVDYLNDALKKGGFTTCKRHAHFFSQVAIESADFIEFTESYYYRLTRIYEVFGNQSNDSYKTLYSQNFWDDNQHLEYISTNNCEHRYEKKKNYSDISNKNERYVGISSVTKTRNGYTITFPRSFDNDTTGIYKRYTIPNLRQNGENLFNLVYKDRNGNTQSGDGWKYRGRGAIQVTGRSNYKATSNKCNAVFEKNFDWENNPDQLETDFESIIYSAVAWFLNAFNPISILDNKTSNQVTGTVNTKREKQAERANKYNNLINNFQLYDCETK
jgi:predicted chitinase